MEGIQFAMRSLKGDSMLLSERKIWYRLLIRTQENEQVTPVCLKIMHLRKTLRIEPV